MCGALKNSFPQWKSQPEQEVEYGYIFVNIFVKGNISIIPILILLAENAT